MYPKRSGRKTIGFEDQQMTCADFKKISSPTKDEATWMELGEEVDLSSLASETEEEELEKVAKAEAIGEPGISENLRRHQTGCDRTYDRGKAGLLYAGTWG